MLVTPKNQSDVALHWLTHQSGGIGQSSRFLTRLLKVGRCVWKAVSHFPCHIQLWTMLWFNAGMSTESGFTQLGACKEERRFQSTCRNISALSFRSAPKPQMTQISRFGLFVFWGFFYLLIYPKQPHFPFSWLLLFVWLYQSLDVPWGTSRGRKRVNLVYFHRWTLALARRDEK